MSQPAAARLWEQAEQLYAAGRYRDAEAAYRELTGSPGHGPLAWLRLSMVAPETSATIARPASASITMPPGKRRRAPPLPVARQA